VDGLRAFTLTCVRVFPGMQEEAAAKLEAILVGSD
jgi:hypothetical protein